MIMIDKEKLQALKMGAHMPIVLVEELRTLSSDALFAIRDALNSVLPNQTLSDVNLEVELMDQFRKIKKLQDDVADDDDVPANQRAQVANAVASTLQQLIRMQSEYHTSERFKALEALMVKAMRTLPIAQAEQFIKDYEEMDL